MKTAAFVLTAGLLLAAGLPLALFALACGADRGRSMDAPATSPLTATPVPAASELPPGIEGRGPTFRPVASDQYGEWQVLEIHGRSVEIPRGGQWDVQGVEDPCFGDERTYVLLEDRATGDRVRVDMVDPKVTTVAADPVGLEPLTERILRSVKGTHQVPMIVQTFGPHPTLTTCAGETPGTVPTLTKDTFTPPAIGTQPPAIITPPVASEETVQ